MVVFGYCSKHQTAGFNHLSDSVLTGSLVVRQTQTRTAVTRTEGSPKNLTRREQDTIIRGSAADQTWEVVTADPRIIRKMEKQGYKPDPRKNPAEYVSYTVPFGRIRILRGEKRKLSAVALANATKRLALFRERQNGSNGPGPYRTIAVKN